MEVADDKIENSEHQPGDVEARSKQRYHVGPTRVWKERENKQKEKSESEQQKRIAVLVRDWKKPKDTKKDEEDNLKLHVDQGNQNKLNYGILI